MQSLYILQTMENTSTQVTPKAFLARKLDESRGLLVALFYFVTKVCRYAETDAMFRANKNLPTTADLNVNTKIAGNLWMWQLLENPSFKAALENDKPERIDNDDEWVRKIYQELVQTDIYQAYITTPHTKKEDTDIVKFIFTDLLLPNEDFVSHLEEFFPNWEDDAEMVNQLALNYFQKGKPMDFTNIVGEEKRLYAHQLLEVVQSKGDYLLELIKPKLNNWDADRIASIDLLLLQMGLAEFLYFETIPTKVTINEYIDLAKEYSTVQSGQFINGLLDNLHKELLKENKIHKVDFKLKA